MNDVTLREYVQKQIDIQEKRCGETVCAIKNELQKLEGRVEHRFEIYKETVLTASKVMDERLFHMNEFREQINKERGEYISRKELELMLAPLKEHCYHQAGEKESNNKWLYILVVVVPTVISLIFKFVG